MTAKTGLGTREPVVVHAIALWLVTNVGAAVVEQYQWLGADEWSSLSKALVPLVTAGIAALAGVLLRRVVTPAWRLIEDKYPEIPELVEDATGVDVDQILADAESTYPAPKPEPAPDPAA